MLKLKMKIVFQRIHNWKTGLFGRQGLNFGNLRKSVNIQKVVSGKTGNKTINANFTAYCSLYDHGLTGCLSDSVRVIKNGAKLMRYLCD